MAKTKISEYDVSAANNTDVDGVNVAESCPPSGINNAIREVMAHLKDFQSGAVAGNALAVASGGTGAETAADARTNLGTAKSGANSDITSLTGLTTPLTVAQGGTGASSGTGSGSPVFATSPTVASPTFTGTVVAPTPTSGDSSTTVATTAYVQATGYNSQGKKVVSTSAPSTTSGYVNGDIWYKY